MESVPQIEVEIHTRVSRFPKPGLVNITREDDTVTVIVTESKERQFRIITVFSCPSETWDALIKESGQ